MISNTGTVWKVGAKKYYLLTVFRSSHLFWAAPEVRSLEPTVAPAKFVRLRLKAYCKKEAPGGSGS